MFNFLKPFARRTHRPAKSAGLILTCERLENRQLLAVGPYLHVHNTNQLAVVDSANGQLEVIHQLEGFAGEDRTMNDLAFSPSGRLYGIGTSWLYEIHPVNGQLTPMGEHGITNATSLVFNNRGTLQAMGHDAPDLFQLTINDTQLVSVNRIATLSGLNPDQGSNGDITYYQGDLMVATTDDRLIQYRFDINPDRPRIIQQFDLSTMGVTDIFGLATVGGNQLFATAGTSVYQLNIANAQNPTADEVPLVDPQFGNLRGAAYFAESGGPVPIGTISGAKWFDRNTDGVRQNNEPTLADWQVYIDQNLNGVYDSGEPLRRTDNNGQYYFFGREPGLYTIDEIVLDATLWEQTFPRTPHRNIVADYGFDGGSTANGLTHDFGLPALTRSLVSVGPGSATYTNVASYLEMPAALGDSPFTIALEASYQTVFGTEQYLVSQMNGAAASDRDFQWVAQPNSLGVSGSFCNAGGTCAGPTLGKVDAARHQYAMTWDGRALGLYFDGELVTQNISGTLPDIDGQAVRFGNPQSLPTAAGLRGTVFEILIFNDALSRVELDNVFGAPLRPNAYSVYLDDQRGLSGIDFGNAEPTVIDMSPEIVVAHESPNGPSLQNGDSLDLGTVSSQDVPPRTEVWISNIGDEALVLDDLTISDAFQIENNPDLVLNPGASTPLDVVLVDMSQGFKTGQLVIENNDSDEDPFVLHLTAEVFDVDSRPRELLINTTAGNILRINPMDGMPQVMLSGGRPLTDIAYHPREDRLFGIDTTFVYEIDLAADVITPLFPHNVNTARALGFSPAGELFAAGVDVYVLDINARTSRKYADGGSTLAGDIAFVGNRMLMSTDNGNLYEVRAGETTLQGNVNGITLNGLASTDPTTLYGFADNRGYLVNVDTYALTPQFGLLIFTVAGATYLPIISAHNPDEPLDVDGDGHIAPLDALLVINELNTPSFTDPATGRLISMPTGMTRFPDTTNDGFVTAADALLVINYLNSPPPANATPAVTEEISGIDQPWFDDLASEIASALLDDRPVARDVAKSHN